MDQYARTSAVIHNVKNKLQLMLPRLEPLRVSDDLPVRESAQQLKQGLLEINQQLIALLSMSRLDQSARLDISESVYVHDLLVSVAGYAEGICQVEVICDEQLQAYFDESLVKVVISDSLHNAVKYTAGRILLCAEKNADGLLISVEDDGPGYHADITGVAQTSEVPNDAFDGALGLGIMLAEQVAHAHQHRGKSGKVSLGRSDTLGGAAFSLLLP